MMTDLMIVCRCTRITQAASKQAKDARLLQWSYLQDEGNYGGRVRVPTLYLLLEIDPPRRSHA